MPPTPTSIAIIDDDPHFRRATEHLLLAAGFDVTAFASAESFLESAERYVVDCVVVDMHLPRMTGLSLIRILEEERGAMPAVLVSARDGQAPLTLRSENGTIPRLRKPFSAHSLLSAIAWVLLR